MVKNPPCNAKNMGSVPGQGTKIPPCQGAAKPTCHTFWAHALEPQLESPCATTEDAMCPNQDLMLPIK